MSNSITTLGDLVEFQRGFDLPKTEFINGNIPVISSNGILGYHNIAKVKGPGITIGRSGTVGLPHFIKEDFYPHNTSLFIKDFKGNVPKYIYYLLSTLKLNEYGSGSGVPTMNRNHLHPIKLFACIEKGTQQKIASVLSALDDKIELNNRINIELEAMVKTLYDYWFVQFDFPVVTSSGVEMPYKSSGGKMVYNETLKKEIPEGWEMKNIKEVCEIVDCLHSKKPECKFEDENFYLLQLENLLDNGLIDISKKYFVSKVDYKNWTSRITVKEHDILFTNAGRVAQTTQVSQEIVSGIGRNITAVRPLHILPTFCFLSINSFDIKKQILNNIDQGAFFQSFNVKGIKLLNFIIPPQCIQEKFEEIVYKIRRKRELNLKQNQELSALRDWLLPMLMNGQVKVGETFVEKRKASTLQIENFNKIKILYTTIWANNMIGAKQGEMATAKDVYLLDRIYGVETGFHFAQHNWGSFDPKEKQLLNTKQYFHKPNFPNSKAYYLDVKDNGKLLASIPEPLKIQITKGLNEMNSAFFSKYRGKEKAEKKELFATVLKCIEDRQALELSIIRDEMSNWKIEQDGKTLTKAEKFTEEDTETALQVINENKWYKNVLL